MRLGPEGIRERASSLREMESPCRLCPRQCAADRRSGRTGFCGATALVEVSSYGPHFGEEHELVGNGGSGTIFFAHCSLGCAFCQNYDVSHLGRGRSVTRSDLAAMMLALEREGCANVNLVTPTHYAPGIVEAIAEAQEGGLRVPIVWNCGGYESVAALRLLDGLVDVYMPDAKFGNGAVAALLCGAPDYPARMAEALTEMQRQVGDLTCNERGLAVRGLLIRHLVMPDDIAATETVLRMIVREVSPHAAVNVMGQYRPEGAVARANGPLARRVTRGEHRAAVELAKELGLRVLE